MVVNMIVFFDAISFCKYTFFSCIKKEVVYREIHNLFYFL